MTLTLYLFAWVLFILALPLIFIPVGEWMRRLLGNSQKHAPSNPPTNEALVLMLVLGALQLTFAYRVFSNTRVVAKLEHCEKASFIPVYTCPKVGGGTELVDCTQPPDVRDDRCSRIPKKAGKNS
ncbi:MAG: hypothetical protein ACR2OR_10880 [Hyphomicrobiales bacterium]